MSPPMSAIGPKQTCLAAPHMSAFEGKADIAFALHMSTYDPKRTWRVRCEMSGRWPVRIPYLDRYGFHDTNDTKQKCHDIRPIQHTIRYLRNILRKVSAHEQ